MEPRNALVARADVVRWTEGYIAASERPWRRGPCRGRSAWHAGGWVSREPGRPHRLHLKGCRGAGTGSPSPRPWTWHLASDGANPQVLGWYPPREGNEARGDGRRGIGAPHTTGEAGESCPRNPVEGRGRREMDPLAGKTANTPRLEPVSTLRQRIAERARHALGMAWVIFIASWTNGYATARSEAICRGAGCGRTRTSGSVGGQGQQRLWSTRPSDAFAEGCPRRADARRVDRLACIAESPDTASCRLGSPTLKRGGPLPYVSPPLW